MLGAKVNKLTEYNFKLLSLQLKLAKWSGKGFPILTFPKVLSGCGQNNK